MNAAKRQALLCSNAQWAYLVWLLKDAFANHYTSGPNLDWHHMPTYYTREQASSDIKRLITAKERGWK